MAEPNSVIIPYSPRRWFIPFHESRKRFRFEVVHRRGGKTVAICNETIKKALTNTREYPPPRYGYIGPSFSQAKDTIWAYLKHYTDPIPGMKINETDLQVTFPNGAIYALYPGADAYQRMRGIYFDGVAMDEFPLLNPDAWGSVVRPCLADYKGWAIIAGTSAGEDHFYEMKVKAEEDPEQWDVFDIKVSDTDCLHPEEVAEMRHDMGEIRFSREMMNNFAAPLEGAYYAEQLTDAEMQGRITSVPWDPRFKVYPSFDLGVRDHTVVWFWQRVGKECRLIECLSRTGKGLEWFVGELGKRPYVYDNWIFPHDIVATELVSGKSREALLVNMGIDYIVVPRLGKIEDGIEATRNTIPICFFDQEKCKTGINALRAYQPAKNGKPLHNWASDYADSFRTGAMGLDLATGWGGAKVHPGMFEGFRGALKRRIQGVY